ncbi:MAG: glycosyltransferase [Pirellulales bacterium]|nr:glycosyltransferase [Pirellulales bacterium]
MVLNEHNHLPLVSVILPAYGRHQFLSESIRSVLGQTYPNIELIVVDDGSREPLENVVQAISPRARCIRQCHAGVAAARNRGLREARGELIAFQDSDDVWHREKLAAQVAFLATHPDVGVVYTAKRVIDEAGRVIGSQWKQLHSGRVTEQLFRKIFVTMPSVVMRRGVIGSVGEFDASLKINSDYQYWLRASLAVKFAAIDVPLVDVRRSTGQLTLARAEAALLQYRMLSSFYGEHECRNVIRSAVAVRVLAKSAFRAAQSFWNEGCLNEAEQLLKESLARNFMPRAAWAWLRVRLVRLFIDQRRAAAGRTQSVSDALRIAERSIADLPRELECIAPTTGKANETTLTGRRAA